MLNSCLKFERERWMKVTKENIDKGPVNITSFFHYGGSDHNISHAGGWMKMSVRVQMLLDDQSGGSRRVLFDNVDDATFSHARYIHTLAMYWAKKYACRKSRGKEWCASANPITKAASWRVVEQNLAIWTKRDGSDVIKARGIQSTFDEGMPSIVIHAMNSVASILQASALVVETAGAGKYMTVTDNIRQMGAPHMMEEQGRVAGVVLMALVALALFVIMLMLRIWLKPMSLGVLAVEQTERGEHMHMLLQENTRLKQSQGEMTETVDKEYVIGKVPEEYRPKRVASADDIRHMSLTRKMRRLPTIRPHFNELPVPLEESESRLSEQILYLSVHNTV